MEEKKTNPALLLIGILILIIGLVLFLDKTGKLDGLKPKEESKVKEITDEKVKEGLDRQVEVVNLTYGDTSRPYGTASFFEKELYKNLSDDRLLNGFLEYYHVHGYAQIFNVRDESLYETYPNLLYVIPSSKVYELSTNLLNKDLSKITTVAEGDNVWLPFVKVDDYYYVSSDGGEPTPTDRALTYNYKYEEDDTKAYVYVSVTKGEFLEESYIIYKGINEKDVYTKFGSDETDEYLKFRITSDNYKEFTKYKYIFDKKEDKYVFNSIEILK